MVLSYQLYFLHLLQHLVVRLKTDLIDRIEAYEEFGLRYDVDNETMESNNVNKFKF